MERERQGEGETARDKCKEDVSTPNGPSLLFGDHSPSMFQDSPKGRIFCYLSCMKNLLLLRQQMLVNTSLVSCEFPSNICANRAVMSPMFLLFRRVRSIIITIQGLERDRASGVDFKFI